MKKYFIAGLVALLPVTLTLIVIIFVFNLLTQPFLGVTQAILGHYGLLDTGFLFLSPIQLETFLTQILILAVLFIFTVLLGAVARWFFVHYFIRFWEYVIHQIPIVSAIYRACQDVIKTIFASKTNAFKQVVMVRFPNQETLTLGLVTRETLGGLESALGSDFMVIFVPTTPNPTSGFLTLCKKEDVIPLDMKIEDAFKYIISCGVIIPSFQGGVKKEFSGLSGVVDDAGAEA